MSKNGKYINAQFTHLGEQIHNGQATFVSLAGVIALAIWREGSEIVLFSYGMIASGHSYTDIGVGALIGGSAGAMIGYATYRGLLSLPHKYYLRTTSVLLIFLVAGMISQSIQFFIAAGWIDILTQRAWDSSWLIADGGALAQILHAIIGYTSHPSILQVIIYISTIGAFCMYLQSVNRSHLRQKSVQSFTALALVAALASTPSTGHAGSKVYSPYVEKGELEFEWKGAYDKDSDNNISGKMKNQFAVGYAFTDYWYTELISEAEREGISGANQEWTALEWENRFQLTQAGEYFVDVGAYAAYEISLEDNHADKTEIGLLLAKETGQFTHYANLFLEKEIGEDTSHATEASFAWSTRYRYKQWLEPGFEVHSEFGELKHQHGIDEQEHLIGPALYGKIGHIKYDMAYLFGATDASPDGQFKWVLEYEMKF